MAATGPNEDLVRCAVAVEGNGDAWVIYSANRKGAHDIYARQVGPKLGKEDKLTDGDAVCLAPVACTDQDGHLHVCFQGWNADGLAQMRMMIRPARQVGRRHKQRTRLPVRGQRQ